MRHKHVYWLRERNQLRVKRRNYKKRDKGNLKEVVGNDHIPVCRTGVPVEMDTSSFQEEGREGKGREETGSIIHSSNFYFVCAKKSKK